MYIISDILVYEVENHEYILRGDLWVHVNERWELWWGNVRNGELYGGMDTYIVYTSKSQYEK